MPQTFNSLFDDYTKAIAKIAQLTEALKCMFETEPESLSNWRYNRSECANIARNALIDSNKGEVDG